MLSVTNQLLCSPIFIPFYLFFVLFLSFAPVVFVFTIRSFHLVLLFGFYLLLAGSGWYRSSNARALFCATAQFLFIYLCFFFLALALMQQPYQHQQSFSIRFYYVEFYVVCHYCLYALDFFPSLFPPNKFIVGMFFLFSSFCGDCLVGCVDCEDFKPQSIH